MSQPNAVDILSDDDDDDDDVSVQPPREDVVIDVSTPVAIHFKKKQRTDSTNSNPNPTTVFIIDDDPTPRKPSLSPAARVSFTATPSFVAETPFADGVSVAKCPRGSSSVSPCPLIVEGTPISELPKNIISIVKSSEDSPGTQTLTFVADTPMSELLKNEVLTVKCNKGISDFRSLPSSVSDTLSVNQTEAFVVDSPAFVVDTPMSELSKCEVPIVKCNNGVANSQPLPYSVIDSKFAGISGLICLESDNESEQSGKVEASKRTQSSFEVSLANEMKWSSRATDSDSSLGNLLQTSKDNLLSASPEGDTSVAQCYPDSDAERLQQTTRLAGEKGKEVNKKKCQNKALGGKRISKEEINRLKEEKKQQKEQEKLQKAAEKAEAAELKKLQKEKQKWEKGKLALKSIVAEIDRRVVEVGPVGGHLLTRFAEKDVSYRITSNPIERSIVWTMTIPEHIAQISCEETEVQYILLVYEAEEFCNLITNESLIDHISQVQHCYPYHTICYLTNRLMAYINKREQDQYKNPTNCNQWSRPPIEQVLSKLTTHFTRVHTRQCIDEAELAEHVVGLSRSLASCQFRKKLTRLSVDANGSIIPKDCVDRNLIKKNVWLKALVAIPKVQPRFAIAIWKKYPTMKSLLSVYMDPNKSVHEKEFLLKDLITEGLFGDDRRLGEVCSKRVYRILTAQCGNIITDDVENGADFFSRQSL